MELLTKGIVLKVENIYETVERFTPEGKKYKEEEYKGFKPEGIVHLSNVEGLKKGDKVQVNPYGGSEIGTIGTKKHRFLVIEERDLLVKL